MFKQFAAVTSTFFKLRDANQNCLSGSVKMKSVFSLFFNPKSVSNFVTVLVFTFEFNDKSSTKINCCFLR